MAKENLQIRVTCHAGYRGEESPLRFLIGDREVEVKQILDRWLDPGYRYFKLRGNDQGIYILRHDSAAGTWELTLFDSGKYEQSRLSST